MRGQTEKSLDPCPQPMTGAIKAQGTRGRQPERTSPHTPTAGPSAPWALSAPSDLGSRPGLAHAADEEPRSSRASPATAGATGTEVPAATRRLPVEAAGFRGALPAARL